jgi:hypothetical protein
MNIFNQEELTDIGTKCSMDQALLRRLLARMMSLYSKPFKIFTWSMKREQTTSLLSSTFAKMKLLKTKNLPKSFIFKTVPLSNPNHLLFSGLVKI